MRRYLVLTFLVFLAFPFLQEGQHAVKESESGSSRMALVIGNAKYEKINKLKYGIEDAQKIASALQALGFNVTFKPDVNKKDFLEALTAWGKEIAKASAKVALFYYVGHGIQVNGTNYLIPVDAYIGDKADIEFESIDARRVLEKMKNVRRYANLMILDACREKPFRDFDISNTSFAEMKALPDNSIIIYSTRSGFPATDENSFSTFFYFHLKNRDSLEITDFLKSVSRYVSDNTGGKQLPIWMGDIKYKFYFTDDRGESSSGNTPLTELPSEKWTQLVSISDTLNQNFVEEMIKRRRFFERCLHPMKDFGNDFHQTGKKSLITDWRTSLMWHQAGSIRMTREKADGWIHALNKKKWAGFDNWRLPTLEEAASLLDESGNPGNDKLYIDNKFSSRQKRIWTSDKVSREKNDNLDEALTYYWVVDFKNGIVARISEDSSVSVRPVRSFD